MIVIAVGIPYLDGFPLIQTHGFVIIEPVFLETLHSIFPNDSCLSVHEQKCQSLRRDLIACSVEALIFFDRNNARGAERSAFMCGIIVLSDKRGERLAVDINRHEWRGSA